MIIKYNNFLLKTYKDGPMHNFCFTPYMLVLYIYYGQKYKCIHLYICNDIINCIIYDKPPDDRFSMLKLEKNKEDLEIEINRKKYKKFIKILEKYLS